MKRTDFRKALAVLLAAVVMITNSDCVGFAAPGQDRGKSSVSEGSAASTSSDSISEDSVPEESVSEDSVPEESVSKDSAPEDTKDGNDTDMAKWTVLAYVCGTDLETEGYNAFYNFDEISRTIPNDSVNLVIETGGTREWHLDKLGLDLDPKKTNRISYDMDGYHLIDELPLQNMASADTLADFISWGQKEYPAEKYMLVLWDHGGGSEGGLIVDEFYDNATMTLSDYESALDRSDAALEAVTVDCCLMATLEMAEAMEGHANYLIASEEVMPGQGSSWEEWMQFLYDAPECSGKEVGAVICDMTQQKYVELGSDMSSSILTMSVIDISRMPEVSKAFDEYFARLGELVKEPEKYRAYLSQTRNAEKYGGGSYGMVDLVDLSDKARKSGVMNDEAIELRKAVMEAVVHNVKGKGRSYAHGMAYFDGTKSDCRTLDHYARSAKSAPYLAYLDEVRTGWTAPDWVYENMDPFGDITYDKYGVDYKLSLADDEDLQLEITDGMEAVAAIDYSIYSKKDDEWMRLGTGTDIASDDESNGVFSADFSGKWPAIGNVFCPMVIDDENEAYTRYLTPVVAEDVDEGAADPDELWTMVGDVFQLVSLYMRPDDEYKPYDLDDYDPENDAEEEDDGGYDDDDGYFGVLGMVPDAINTEDSSIPSRVALSMRDLIGLKLRVLYPAVDKYTGYDTYIEGDTVTVQNDTLLQMKTLPAGEYGYSFIISDLMGNERETEIVSLSWDGENAVYTLEYDEEESEAEEMADDEDDAEADYMEDAEADGKDDDGAAEPDGDGRETEKTEAGSRDDDKQDADTAEAESDEKETDKKNNGKQDNNKQDANIPDADKKADDKNDAGKQDTGKKDRDKKDDKNNGSRKDEKADNASDEDTGE